MKPSRSAGGESIRTGGCDTLVALPEATADGSTLFGKNSDRPCLECQPLVQFPPRRHAKGSRVQCQYLTLPQVRKTHGFLGSQPYWLWGVEHGVNDCRVAIGNEAVFTRDRLPEIGLLGMDLVRLALERAETAEDALLLMIELIERYGQGGGAHPGTDFGYHNSFLMADPKEAWILETSGRRWAAKRVEGVGSISNHVAVEDDWLLASHDLEAHAVAEGWWRPQEGRRFRFAKAYRSTKQVPGRLSQGRLARSRSLLAAESGELTVERFMRFLRDHGEGGTVLPTRRDQEDASFFTLCLHVDPAEATTASMVARLRQSPDGRPDAWVSLAGPCTGVFLPLYLQGDVPAVLGRGGPEPDNTSPWWRLKALRDAALAGSRRELVRLQAYWGEWERHLLHEAEEVAGRMQAARRSAGKAKARRLASGFMARAVDETLRRLDAWPAGETKGRTPSR
jgi:secernin